MTFILSVMRVSFLLAALLPIVIANPAPAPAVTEGPQAYISYEALPAFSTLKPCAQGCLRYNGVYHCSLQGYWDLGKELKCGCSPLNYCICDKREAAAASSYINKCVATQCTLPNEVSAVLDLYNGYCATANVEITSSTTKPYSFTGVTVGSSKTATPAGGNGVTSGNNAAQETSGSSGQVNSANHSGAPKGPVLGLGTIIGIAVGGVILIAALLCIGCCLVWKRKRNKRRNGSATTATNQGFSNGTSTATSETAYVAPTDGAAQLDGKPGTVKVDEKPLGSVGGSTTVSPFQTPQPTPQPAMATAFNPVSPIVGTHEVHGNHNRPVNAHEVQGNHQQYHNYNAHEAQGNGGYQTNAHEMYGNHQQYQSQNTYEVQENGGYQTNAHEMYGGGSRGNGELHEICTQSPRVTRANI